MSQKSKMGTLFMDLSYNHLFVALYKVAHKDEDAHDLALSDALHITASHLHINHNGPQSLWGSAPGKLLHAAASDNSHRCFGENMTCSHALMPVSNANEDSIFPR